MPPSLAQSGAPEIPGRVAEDRSGGRVLMEARPWKCPGISNLKSSRPDIGKGLLRNTINAHPFRIGGVDSAGTWYQESVSLVTYMV